MISDNWRASSYVGPTQSSEFCDCELQRATAKHPTSAVTFWAWVCPPLLISPHIPNLSQKPLFSDICRAGFILYCVSCLWKPFTRWDSRTWTCNQTRPLNVLSSHTVTASPTYLSDRSVQLSQLMARSYPPSPACFIHFRVTRFSSPTADPSWRHLLVLPQIGLQLYTIMTVPHSGMNYFHPCPQHATACEQVSLLSSLSLGIVFTGHKDISSAMAPDLHLTASSVAGCACFKKQQSGEGRCSHPGAYSLDSGASALSSRLPCPHSLKMQSCNTAVLDLIKPSFSPH